MPPRGSRQASTPSWSASPAPCSQRNAFAAWPRFWPGGGAKERGILCPAQPWRLLGVGLDRASAEGTTARFPVAIDDHGYHLPDDQNPLPSGGCLCGREEVGAMLALSSRGGGGPGAQPPTTSGYSQAPPRGGAGSAAVAPPASRGDSPSPRRGSEAGVSFAAKSQHTGTGCVSHAAMAPAWRLLHVSRRVTLDLT